MSAKQTAALGLLGDMKIDFDNVHETLVKILSNIVNTPTGNGLRLRLGPASLRAGLGVGAGRPRIASGDPIVRRSSVE